MGLDFACVMIAIEERFGITITSDELDLPDKRILVKDLYDIVERNTCKQAASVLESQNFQEKVLDDVKQVFAEGLDLSESDRWTNETTLQQLYEEIPATERRTRWKQFRTHPYTQISKTIKGIIDSKYQRHLLVAWCGYIIFVFVMPACLGQYFFQLGLVFPLLFLVPGTILWLSIWNRQCQTNHNVSPPNVTLGEIAEQIVSRHQKSLKDNGSPYTRTEIEEIVKKILCDELAIRNPEKVTPESDLIRDLGMG